MSGWCYFVFENIMERKIIGSALVEGKPNAREWINICAVNRIIVVLRRENRKCVLISDWGMTSKQNVKENKVYWIRYHFGELRNVC